MNTDEKHIIRSKSFKYEKRQHREWARKKRITTTTTTKHSHNEYWWEWCTLYSYLKSFRNRIKSYAHFDMNSVWNFTIHNINQDKQRKWMCKYKKGAKKREQNTKVTPSHPNKMRTSFKSTEIRPEWKKSLHLRYRNSISL